MEIEIHNYTEMAKPKLTVNVLQWWKEHGKELPLLSAVAKDI